MQKRCPNGHVYDPTIYGNQCPLCPVGVVTPAGSGPTTHLGGGNGSFPNAVSGDLHTHIASTTSQSRNSGIPSGSVAQGDPSGATRMRPQEAVPSNGGHTVIRHATAAGRQQVATPVRKLVGFLVTYNRDPNGRAYNLYEGRNYIGRGDSCDIKIPDDDQMSGKHLSILYRNVDNKFKFRDEQSSNGTFVNKELLDDGELENYDIIRAGNTLFIFIAIPNIF